MISDSRFAEDFWRHGKSDLCPVIDMHGHMGRWRGIYFPRASAQAMLRTMDSCGVRLLVFCHHAALFCPEIGNAIHPEIVRGHEGRLRAYLGINPNYPEAIRRDLAAFDENRDVYAGLKILAGYHQISWQAPAFEPVWEFANCRRLIVLAHTWGTSTFDGPQQVRAIAGKYPNVRLIVGHSLHGQWEEAITIAREFPHLHWDLCAVMDDAGVLERFVAAGFGRRMLFGTDLPWFDPHYYIGAVLSAHISDEDRLDIFHRNARRLLDEAGVKWEDPGR